MRKVYLLFMACILASHLFAQSGITGNVFDSGTGEALVGASVVIIGSNTGVITDLSGSFSIDVDKKKYSEITISYVGYDPVTINIANSNHFTVPLNISYTLDEVVIQAIRGNDPGYECDR